MGTGWKYATKCRTRPIKSTSERTRRQKVQRRRLEQLGVDAEVVASLGPGEVRELLRRPKLVQRALAAE